MSWLKIDDQFFFHRKVINLSKDAKLLHLSALAYCAAQSKNGVLTAAAVRIAASAVDAKITAIKELVIADLWHEEDGGEYSLHDFNEYNPTPEQIEAKKSAAADRQRRFRGRHQPAEGNSSNAVTESVTDNVTNAVNAIQSNAVTPCVRAFPSPFPIPFVPSEQKEETPSASKKEGVRQKSRMTEEWEPADEAKVKAAANYPSLDIPEETEKFRNYWLEKGELRADWLAGWRNWLINAKKFAAEQAAADAPPPPRKRDRIDEIAEEAGAPGVRMTNFSDPREADAREIAAVEKQAAEWGVSYEEAAERRMAEVRKAFPHLSIRPIPPQPKDRQRMAA